MTAPIRVLNSAFHPVTLQETVDRGIAGILAGNREYFCTVNVAILMMMRRDERLRRFVEGASLVVADGAPIVWAARLLSQPLPERVAGPDIVESLCERAEREGIGVYLLGATRPTVEELARRLRARLPALRICGVADGYFTPEEAAERALDVAKSEAQLLFVGMGVPRQENFIEEHWDELGVRLAIGVGGSFDVLAGLRRRAPRILQRVGLEWAFRLAQEPGRLWKRYLVTNTEFLALVAGELIGRLRARTPENGRGS